MPRLSELTFLSLSTQNILKMARTKGVARKGEAGKSYRQAHNTGENYKIHKDNRKRKLQQARDEQEQAMNESSPTSQPPPKKSKNQDTSINRDDNNLEEPVELVSEPQSTANTSNTTTTNTTLLSDFAPSLIGLATTHEVTTFNISSVTKIQKRVIPILELLSIYPAIPPKKPAVVVLQSKAKVASKMVTIAEIVKREIAGKGGKWFQYNCVENILTEKKKDGQKEKDERRGKGEEEEDSGEDSDSAVFEIMKTPFERAIEGKPKVQGVPVMTLYLSRVRIEGLKKSYG